MQNSKLFDDILPYCNSEEKSQLYLRMRSLMGQIGVQGVVDLLMVVASDFGEGNLGEVGAIPPDPIYLELAAILSECRDKIQSMCDRPVQ